MALFNLFSKKELNTATTAKERLQIIVTHQRKDRNSGETPKYLKKMQEEILQVIKKYVDIDDQDVNVNVDSNNTSSMIELNVSLPGDS